MGSTETVTLPAVALDQAPLIAARELLGMYEHDEAHAARQAAYWRREVARLEAVNSRG